MRHTEINILSFTKDYVPAYFMRSHTPRALGDVYDLSSRYVGTTIEHAVQNISEAAILGNFTRNIHINSIANCPSCSMVDIDTLIRIESGLRKKLPEYNITIHTLMTHDDIAVKEYTTPFHDICE